MIGSRKTCVLSRVGQIHSVSKVNDFPNTFIAILFVSVLLRFLRVCKFSVPGACAKLENYLCIHQAYPKWFKNISIDDQRVRELLEAEYVIPLPEKDQFGRQVLLFQTGHLDSKKFTSVDLMHMAELIFQIFYDDEETQVGGFMCIFDDTGFNMGHVTMWNLSDVRDAVKYVSRGMPIRSRGWYRINFPSYGQTIYDFIKGLLSAKIKNRLQVKMFLKVLINNQESSEI